MAEIRHQISIDVIPEKVYAALTSQAGLRSWWTADTIADDRVGGNVELGFDRKSIIFRMRIEQLQPAILVLWSCHGDLPEWIGTTLTWKISAENGKSVLRFTHANWKAITDLYAICNSSWGELTYRIKNYLEGRNPGPLWKE
jgi:uncharacterized protein YndB with AHSA1/START domain